MAARKAFSIVCVLCLLAILLTQLIGEESSFSLPVLIFFVALSTVMLLNSKCPGCDKYVGHRYFAFWRTLLKGSCGNCRTD